MDSVADWALERRLEAVLQRALPKLGPEAKAQLQTLLTPQALAAVSAVLVAWVVSHAFGIGEVIDLILAVVGAVSIGMAVFDGLDRLYDFALGTYRARSSRDFDDAASHLAAAVNILGIQAVLAVLFRGAPKTYRGGLPKWGPSTAVGKAYKPSVRWVKYEPGVGRLAAGEGWTTSWGDIVLSSRGSANTRQLVLFHERIHQLLTPKVYALRDFRIANRDASYRFSSLSRYLEEALAETVAQVRVFGMQKAFVGIRFPVRANYVYLLRHGAGPRHSRGLLGDGIAPELLGLTAGVIEVAGMYFDVYFGPGGAEPPDSADRRPCGAGASGSW